MTAPAERTEGAVLPGFLIRIRRWLRAGFDGGAADQPGSAAVARLIVFVILVGSLIAMLETEQSLWSDEEVAAAFRLLDGMLLAFFSLEYLLRFWAAGEIEAFRGWRGRLRWALRPWHLFDLALIAVFLLPHLGAEIFILRFLRIGRVFMVLRLTRLTAAGQLLGSCIYARRYELLVSVMMAFLLMVVAAVGLYLVEGVHQPDAFGSVPRALWWAMATLTTVGYGDVYPVSPLGKIMAGAVAFIGIGVIAIPTGIVAGAFANAMARPAASVAESREAVSREGQDDEESSGQSGALGTQDGKRA